MGQSATEAKRTTRLLNKYYEELRQRGVIHWNRRMGMKKLKEMFPEHYERELSELRTRPPEGRTEQAL